MVDIDAQYQNLPDWETLPIRKISWGEALRMATKHNMDMARARITIEDAERQARSVYMDIIPLVNLDAIMNKRLKSASTMQTDELTYHVNVLFNLPSLSQLPIDVYTAQAQVYAVKKAYELKERELVSKLYKVARQRRLQEELYNIEKTGISKDDNEWKQKDMEYKKDEERRSDWLEISKLLGSTSARWEIDWSTVPHLKWDYYMKASQHIDVLVLTMMAMQLEASKMAVYDALMEYLPQINIDFYSPALFSTTGGTYSGFFGDSKDMTLNMNASLQLDTQLKVWDRYQKAKAEHEFFKRELKIRLIERKGQVRQVVKSCNDSEDWKSYMYKRIDFLRLKEPQDAVELMAKRDENTAMEREILTQEQRKVDSEAAMILEYGLVTE